MFFEKKTRFLPENVFFPLFLQNPIIEKRRSSDTLLGDAETKLSAMSASQESKPSRIPAFHHEPGDVDRDVSKS